MADQIDDTLLIPASLARTFHLLADAVMIEDGAHRIALWNAAAEQLFGYPESLMLGRDADCLLPDAEAAQTLAQRAMVLQGQGVQRFEAQRLHSDGRLIDVAISMSPLDAGAGVIWIIRDMSRQKAADTLLRDREFKLAAIVGHSPSVLSLKTPDGCYALANPNLQRILHLPEAQIVGKTDAELFPEETARAFRANDERVLQSGARHAIEEWMPVDGARRLFMSHMFPVPDENGVARFICRISLDITDRKLAETALRDSEKRFRATFDQAAVGIALLTPEGRWLQTNGRLCGFLGYSREELAPLSIRDITHPEDFGPDMVQKERLLRGEIPSFQMEKRYRRKSGDYMWGNLSVSLVRDAGGEPEYLIAVIEDISQRKLAEQRAIEAALHDPLTGLPNRTLAFEYGSHLIASAQRARKGGALLFIDIDRFKPINDLHGHETGDKVLQEVARRLKVCTRKEDLVARLGGDEFLILLSQLPATDFRGVAVAQHVLESLAVLFRVGALELQVTPSIGISWYPEHGNDLDTLIRAADLAMHQAKQAGRSNYRIYTTDLEREAEKALTIEMQLKRALTHGGLVLHYQPVVDIHSGRLVAAEALLRMRGPDGALVSPQHLIPVAEATGLIGDIGAWVAAEACRQIRAWTAQGLPPVSVAVNVSPIQFRRRGFRQRLLRVIEDAGIDPSCLQLEVTESTVMENVDDVIEALTEIKAVGVRIALDDFGTGYSSLGLLTSLPLDKIKIDQSFVRRLEREESSVAVTRAIVALGSSLKLQVVGEGIENEAALNHLRAIGCDQAQGYLISRPLPADEFVDWWRLQASDAAGGLRRAAH